MILQLLWSYVLPIYQINELTVAVVDWWYLYCNYCNCKDYSPAFNTNISREWEKVDGLGIRRLTYFLHAETDIINSIVKH